jgi:Domain of unknown function (DUF4878)
VEGNAMTSNGRVVTVGAMLLAVTLAGCGESPEAAYRAVGAAAARGDWGAVYDRLDKKSQGRMDMGMKMLAGMGAAFSKDKANVEAVKDANGRDLFIKFADEKPVVGQNYRSAKFLSTKVEGDRATLTVERIRDGKPARDTVHMIKEDGRWKITSDSP